MIDKVSKYYEAIYNIAKYEFIHSKSHDDLYNMISLLFDRLSTALNKNIRYNLYDTKSDYVLVSDIIKDIFTLAARNGDYEVSRNFINSLQKLLYDNVDTDDYNMVVQIVDLLLDLYYELIESNLVIYMSVTWYEYLVDDCFINDTIDRITISNDRLLKLYRKAVDNNYMSMVMDIIGHFTEYYYDRNYHGYLYSVIYRTNDDRNVKNGIRGMENTLACYYQVEEINKVYKSLVEKLEEYYSGNQITYEEKNKIDSKIKVALISNNIRYVFRDLYIYSLYKKNYNSILLLENYNQPEDTDVHYISGDVLPKRYDDLMAFIEELNTSKRAINRVVGGHASDSWYYDLYNVLIILKKAKKWDKKTIEITEHYRKLRNDYYSTYDHIEYKLEDYKKWYRDGKKYYENIYKEKAIEKGTYEAIIDKIIEKIIEKKSYVERNMAVSPIIVNNRVKSVLKGYEKPLKISEVLIRDLDVTEKKIEKAIEEEKYYGYNIAFDKNVFIEGNTVIYDHIFEEYGEQIAIKGNEEVMKGLKGSSIVAKQVNMEEDIDMYENTLLIIYANDNPVRSSYYKVRSLEKKILAKNGNVVEVSTENREKMCILVKYINDASMNYYNIVGETGLEYSGVLNIIVKGRDMEDQEVLDYCDEKTIKKIVFMILSKISISVQDAKLYLIE